MTSCIFTAQPQTKPLTVHIVLSDVAFVFKTKNSSHIATHLVLLLLLVLDLVGSKLFIKVQGSGVSNRIEMKFSRIVPHADAHQLTESDF